MIISFRVSVPLIDLLTLHSATLSNITHTPIASRMLPSRYLALLSTDISLSNEAIKVIFITVGLKVVIKRLLKGSK